MISDINVCLDAVFEKDSTSLALPSLTIEASRDPRPDLDLVSSSLLYALFYPLIIILGVGSSNSLNFSFILYTF